MPYPCCCKIACTTCDNDPTGTEWVVTFSGVGNLGVVWDCSPCPNLVPPQDEVCPCCDCADLDGSYTLALVVDEAEETVDCSWVLGDGHATELLRLCINEAYGDMVVNSFAVIPEYDTIGDLGRWRLEMYYTLQTASCRATWYSAWSSGKVKCDGPGPVTFTHDSDTCGGSFCDLPGATVTMQIAS